MYVICLKDALSRELQVKNERSKEVRVERSGDYYSEQYLRDVKKLPEPLS